MGLKRGEDGSSPPEESRRVPGGEPGVPPASAHPAEGANRCATLGLPDGRDDPLSENFDRVIDPRLSSKPPFDSRCKEPWVFLRRRHFIFRSPNCPFC